MNVSRPPGIRMVFPGIRTRANRQETIDTFFIRQTAAYSKKVRVERSWPLIPFVEIAASGIGLPDLQERIRHSLPALIKHPAGHNNALTNCLAASSSISREIGILWGDGTDGGARPCQLRKSQRHVNEWKRRGTAACGLICLVQIGRKDLPIPSYDCANGCMIHHMPSWFTFFGSASSGVDAC